ncbi:hypothetical protein Vadar_001403 [Vaccinium darrowii]|uniref:Uncharacterized protein n=1 Tax=Vaccinium darrowii TaxID=229202 RepID=A0ACB7WX31_9ERIC|nr:hypothetical protein Vadar_001403 [Vaccinium darrowii]
MERRGPTVEDETSDGNDRGGSEGQPECEYGAVVVVVLGMENENDKSTNSRKGGKTKEKGVNASRKTWVQKEELALLNALKEMVVARGEKRGKDSFKAGYLKKLEGMLVVALPGTDICVYPHISSKIKVWKKNHNSIKDMCNTSGFGWNDSKRMVEVDSDSVWENYCKKGSNANGLRYKSFPYYEDWCIIFGNDRATGEMAESAADMVEAIDIEGDADEDGDGSTTVNKNDKSPQDPPKKKAKVFETLMAGLSNFANKLVSSLESSNATLEKVGARMGYAHDLSAKRGAVNAELAKLPISTVDRVKVGLGITKDTQTVDHFFSLKTEEEKLILVQTILECGF